MKAEQQNNEWRQIVIKAWQDETFKKRLLAEPTAVLKEYGVEVAPGVQLRLVENTAQILHLTLPSKPTGELSDEELNRVAGGDNLVFTSVSNVLKTRHDTVKNSIANIR